MKDWPSTWSPCNPNTGMITKTRETEKPPLNGGATCGPTITNVPCINGPSGPLILLQTTGLIQKSGQGVIPNINFSIMRIEIIGGGGRGGDSTSVCNSYIDPLSKKNVFSCTYSSGGGGGAGAYRDIRINNQNLTNLTYTYEIGAGGTYLKNGQNTNFILNGITYTANGGSNGSNSITLFGGAGGRGGISTDSDGMNGNNGLNGSFVSQSTLYTTNNTLPPGSSNGANTIYGSGGIVGQENGIGAGSGGAGSGFLIYNKDQQRPKGFGAPGGIIISYYGSPQLIQL